MKAKKTLLLITIFLLLAIVVGTLAAFRKPIRHKLGVWAIHQEIMWVKDQFQDCKKSHPGDQTPEPDWKTLEALETFKFTLQEIKSDIPSLNH